MRATEKKLDRKGGDYLIVQHGYLIGGHPVMHHGAAKVFDKYGRLWNQYKSFEYSLDEVANLAYWKCDRLWVLKLNDNLICGKG